MLISQLLDHDLMLSDDVVHEYGKGFFLSPDHDSDSVRDGFGRNFSAQEMAQSVEGEVFASEAKDFAHPGDVVDITRPRLYRFVNMRERNHITLVIRADHHAIHNGESERQADSEASALAKNGLDRDVTLEAFDVGSHHVHSH